MNTLNVLAGTAWDGDSAAATRSANELTKWAPTVKGSTTSTYRSAGLFALGLWALSHGDTGGVEAANSVIRSLRATPNAPWTLVTPMIHEKLLAAHLAVARNSPEVRTLLEQLDSLLIDSPVNYNFVLNPGNLLVSRLWKRLPDDQRAWNAIGRRHMMPVADEFASARLRASARIAERLGKLNEAIAALRTYVAIRANADAAHQPDLLDARATLARLEKERRGR